MTKLFIIGNGFDSAHTLPTSYNHFKEFLLSNNPQIKMDELVVPDAREHPKGGLVYNDNDVLSMLFYLISQAVEDPEDWSDVEQALGKLDFNEVFDGFDEILDNEGDVDLFKTSNMFEDIASNLVVPTLTIQSLFSDWINTIKLVDVIPLASFGDLLEEQDQFLTFNYTDTLEHVYGISDENICHIHGYQHGEIYFGHGNTEDYTEVYMQSHVGSQYSLRQIDEQLRKRTEEALQSNIWFFSNLESLNIREVYSYGFSYSKVDEVYITEICNRLKTKNVTWYFNDYDIKNHDKYKAVLIQSGYEGVFSTFHISNLGGMKHK